MNTVVIYQSSTGFTRQYALWMAEELKCRAVSLKETSGKEIENADLVIFGGWVMGGIISGLDKMRKRKPKRLAVFAVGCTPMDIADIAAIKAQNHLNEVSFFYMPGGFRFEKLNFIVKGMLKTLKKSAAKKEMKTAQEQFMADVLGTSFNYSDRKYIEPFVDYVRNIDE